MRNMIVEKWVNRGRSPRLFTRKSLRCFGKTRIVNNGRVLIVYNQITGHVESYERYWAYRGQEEI